MLGFVFLRLHIHCGVFWLRTVTVGRIQSEQVDIDMQQHIVEYADVDQLLRWYSNNDRSI